MKAKRALTTAAMVTGGVALALWYSAPAGAEAATKDDVTLLGTQVNLLWVIIGVGVLTAVLLWFYDRMQPAPQAPGEPA